MLKTLTNTTVAGGWETLEFDFSNHQPNTPALDPNNIYDKVVVFFNFGTSPAADETYYWDNVMFGGLTDVTFRVDMSNEATVNSDSIFLAGSFNGWSDNTVMTDANGDNTFEVTVTLRENSNYEFKFKNGPSGWENIDTNFGDSCVVSGGFGNRFVDVGAMDMTLLDYCFNTCTTCDVVNSTDPIAPSVEFEMMPNPATNYVQLFFNGEFLTTEKNIIIHNAMGQVVFNTQVNNVQNYSINTTNLVNGLYFISVRTNDGILTKRLVVSH